MSEKVWEFEHDWRVASLCVCLYILGWNFTQSHSLDFSRFLLKYLLFLKMPLFIAIDFI